MVYSSVVSSCGCDTGQNSLVVASTCRNTEFNSRLLITANKLDAQLSLDPVLKLLNVLKKL